MGDVSGTGVLAGGQSGTALWLFVPTRDAAPIEPAIYSIGGTLRYIENGEEVVLPLLPATITVRPDPLLVLDYFLERDVFADDPFTAPVEPSIPFTLGVLVSNDGAGDARNFRITSGQPKIIEDEKGLLIDFKIIGTQVGEQEVNPSLTANFGDIEAGTSESARWLIDGLGEAHSHQQFRGREDRTVYVAQRFQIFQLNSDGKRQFGSSLGSLKPQCYDNIINARWKR